jgi:prepilin-type N-terminal cleavage/methylation domain-containing protein
MRRDGFTLAELLVSLAVLAIISVYLSNMMTQQNRAYTVIDQVTQAQGNARALLDLLEREVRSTGGLAPEAAAVCGIDNTNQPDVLFVTDRDVYDFDENDQNNQYDAGAQISAGFAGVGSGETLTLSTLAPDKKPFHDTDGDAVADSDFRPGAGVIVVDVFNPDRGAACGVVVPGGVDVGNKRITVDFTAGASNAALAGVGVSRWAVPAHRYSCDLQGRLMRDGLVLAEDVEDLQVAYFFDQNPENGAIESAALEYPGDKDGNQYDPADWNNSKLREIRLSFVVRSSRPDQRLPGAVPQALENHAPAPVADGFRRRVFTATVRPRNVGHRLETNLL